MKPTQDFVFIRVTEAEKKSAGGIVIPELAREKPQTGTVVAVGPGTYQHGQFVKTTLQSGDFVIFKKYGGDVVEIDGDEVLIAHESDVIAVDHTETKVKNQVTGEVRRHRLRKGETLTLNKDEKVVL